ncbi:MAG TPA: TlpA disulfide reductase family protein [Bryobacteraceae bacterium]|nr:TlpA disulfide reductase family protein [Bryobacteraceae bacterium]
MAFPRWLPAAALLALLVPAAPAADLPRKAPDLTIKMVDAKPITLSQYKGHVVVLAFILTSCSHCQHTVQVLSTLQKEYAPRGLQVVASAIEQDAQNHVRLFVRNFAPTFPVGYNTGAEADAVIHPTGKLPMMPLLGFFDRQGVLRAQHEGEEPFFNDLEASLRHEIDALLQAKR